LHGTPRFLYRKRYATRRVIPGPRDGLSHGSGRTTTGFRSPLLGERWQPSNGFRRHQECREHDIHRIAEVAVLPMSPDELLVPF
jgi:hypothetical protein